MLGMFIGGILMKNGPMTCFRQQVNQKLEKKLFDIAVDLIKFCSTPENIKQKQFLYDDDIKDVVRSLLKIVTGRKKISITRNIDLFIERYRAEKGLPPKKTTVRLQK